MCNFVESSCVDPNMKESEKDPNPNPKKVGFGCGSSHCYKIKINPKKREQNVPVCFL
jgi:hypothetical protein